MAEYIERGEAIMTLLQGGCYASNIEDIMNIHAADVVPARHGHCMGSDRKITNADMIRAMSDEKLAANLMCPNEMGIADIPCDKSDKCDCYKCLLDWMRQSAVEEVK